MIQFKRGSTNSWKKLKKPLAAGQPGYDKDKHKIKIGDGEKLWDKLPYASISEEEVLDSEVNAKKRLALDPGSMAIMTYGTDGPDKNTVGQLYLQYYDAEPEVDYVVESGVDGIWTYQVWRSGIAKCWGTYTLTTVVSNAFDNEYLYCDEATMTSIKYPISFRTPPSETATLKSPSGTIAWLASRSTNTEDKTGLYSIISPDKQNSKAYKITLDVKGYIDN